MSRRAAALQKVVDDATAELADYIAALEETIELMWNPGHEGPPSMTHGESEVVSHAAMTVTPVDSGSKAAKGSKKVKRVKSASPQRILTVSGAPPASTAVVVESSVEKPSATLPTWFDLAQVDSENVALIHAISALEADLFGHPSLMLEDQQLLSQSFTAKELESLALGGESTADMLDAVVHEAAMLALDEELHAPEEQRLSRQRAARELANDRLLALLYEPAVTIAHKASQTEDDLTLYAPQYAIDGELCQAVVASTVEKAMLDSLLGADPCDSSSAHCFDCHCCTIISNKPPPRPVQAKLVQNGTLAVFRDRLEYFSSSGHDSRDINAVSKSLIHFQDVRGVAIGLSTEVLPEYNVADEPRLGSVITSADGTCDAKVENSCRTVSLAVESLDTSGLFSSVVPRTIFIILRFETDMCKLCTFLFGRLSLQRTKPFSPFHVFQTCLFPSVTLPASTGLSDKSAGAAGGSMLAPGAHFLHQFRAKIPADEYYPGSVMVTGDELEFCTTHHLHPRDFLLCKRTLTQDPLRRWVTLGDVAAMLPPVNSEFPNFVLAQKVVQYLCEANDALRPREVIEVLPK